MTDSGSGPTPATDRRAGAARRRGRRGRRPARGTALDRAWPGWADGDRRRSSRPTGASRAPSPSGSRPTWSSATSTRRTRDRVAAARGRGRHGRSGARRQGRVGHGAGGPRGGAPRRDPADDPRRARRAAARPRAGQRLAARAATRSGDVPTVLLDERVAGLAARGARARRRAGRRGPLPGAIGAIVSLLPFGGDVDGRHDPRTCATRCATSRSSPGRPAACRTCARDRPRPSRSGAGRLLIVEAAAPPGGLSSAAMSTPQAGDLAPEVALPDEHGTIHRLTDRAGSWTVVYFYPEDDTPGLHDRGLPVPRPPRRDRRTWTPRSGGSAPTAPAAMRRSGRSSGCRSRCSRTRTTRSPTPTARGRRRTTTGASTGASSARATSSTRTDGSPRAWPKVKADGHAAEVLAALESARAERAG